MPRMCVFDLPAWDWDASPSLLVYGPEDNLAERRWAAWAARPPSDRLVQATLDEDRLRELASMPPRTVHGARYVVALFGLERAKPAARRMLAGFLDGDRTVVLFAHSMVGLEAAASRCLFARVPSADPPDADLVRLAAADRAACLEAVTAYGPSGGRARLTRLFQSGVTLAEFFRAVLASVPSSAELVHAAASLQLNAGFHTVVHAEAFMGLLSLSPR